MDEKSDSLAPHAIAASGSPDFAAETLQRLLNLKDSLESLQLVDLGSRSQGTNETLRLKTMHQISDYLIPRLSNLQAPLLIVVGGSTGAGKSTLVNSLLHDKVSISGAVRPTTRTPVLVFNPADELWFSDQRILPDLCRVTGSGFDATAGGSGRTDAILLAAHPSVPAGIAIVDAPDIDSVAADNRALATQLLNAADLWIFVTTANRYADAVPWDVLTEAGARKITVCVVLNRVPLGAESEIVPDLQRLLAEKNLDSSLLHMINEVQLDAEQMIRGELIKPLSAWLNSLAANTQERQRIALQTLVGALKGTTADVGELVAEVQDQELQLTELQFQVEQRFEHGLQRTQDGLKDGSLLRGEILSRWQDFVGAGELLRGVEGAVGRIRDRIGSFFTGKPPATHRVEQAIESGLHTVLIAECTAAFIDVDRNWKNTPMGQVLLDDVATPRPPADLDERAAEVIRSWQKDVLDMIRTEGAGKRKTARIAAFGVNGIAVVLMVVVFASTAGLTGLEIGIAGGSAVVGQKLLEAIFGEDAVRRMATRARLMLSTRTTQLMEENADIYRQVISQYQQQEITQQLMKFIDGQERWKQQ